MSEDELAIEPQIYVSPRRCAVFADPFYDKAYYKEPFWNKQPGWEVKLFNAISGCPVFQQLGPAILEKLVRAMEIQLRYPSQYFAVQGEPAGSMMIVLQGSVNCVRDGRPVAMHMSTKDNIIDEAAVIWGSPRKFSLVAMADSEAGNAPGQGGGECIVGKLNRVDFVNLTVRQTVFGRMDRQELMRKAKLLEMMGEEQIAKLADILEERTVEEGGLVIRQGDAGHEFFIVTEGVARVWVKNKEGGEIEYCRYGPGDLFGELALLKGAPRAANVTAVTVLRTIVLARERFDRLFGSMAEMQEQQYLSDPRKLIADFYSAGDNRGSAGTLQQNNWKPEPEKYGVSDWFVVYRPCSKDAIARMLSGAAVGKGLNVKGKSSKQGVLSGLVPFIQISDNKHKPMIEVSPPAATLRVYFKTAAARGEAVKFLKSVLADGKTQYLQQYTSSCIKDENSYVVKGGGVYGITIPEALCREAWIMRPDLSPVVGWESGRRSEPFSMDMNLHGIRDGKDPVIVLFQFDEADPMNPRGLLVAYSEVLVKPVVSDFDTFTIGSKGIEYEKLPLDQAELVTWSLEHTKVICSSLDHNNWTSRWIEVIKTEGEKGFHPQLPKYGFGDPTSIRLIEDVVKTMHVSGAIRHGAECCNFFFPQELDEELLVIHHPFPDKPWDYFTEEKTRQFLIDRVNDGFAFPINPVWPVRDQGWFKVFEALTGAAHAKSALASWYPPETNILEKIVEVHKAVPDGFKVTSAPIKVEEKKEKPKDAPAAAAPKAAAKAQPEVKKKKKFGLF